MSKLQKDQTGFSAVEIVLVLVIVVLIGSVSWLVYKNHHKTTTATVMTTTSTKPATTKSTSTTTTTTPTTSSQSTFKILELGIELVNVPSSINGLTYSVSTVNSTLPHTSAGFSTTTLVNKDPSCSNTEGGGSIGNINRVTGTYNASADQGPFKFVKQFNGFWIDFADNGVPCSQDSAIVGLQATQGTTFESFVTNPSNVQLVQ